MPSNLRDRQELVALLLESSILSGGQRSKPGSIVASMLKDPKRREIIQSLTAEDFGPQGHPNSVWLADESRMIDGKRVPSHRIIGGQKMIWRIY